MAKESSSVGKKIAKKKRSGRVEFIAQIEDIKTALKEGWTKKDIWDQLHSEGKISFTYQMFLRYVDQLIVGKKKDANSPSLDSQTETAGAVDTSSEQNEKVTPAAPKEAKAKTIKTQPTDRKEVVRPENAKDVPDDDLY